MEILPRNGRYSSNLNCNNIVISHQMFNTKLIEGDIKYDTDVIQIDKRYKWEKNKSL
jgi:hypothetical protein